jgi:quinohemoprotein ethanol dehydrogenase
MPIIIAAAAAAASLLLGSGANSFAKDPDSGLDQWTILGNGSDQQYYSAATQISVENVRQLGLVWYADMPVGDGLVGNPLVADGVIYQGGPPGAIYANDLQTGKLLWQFTPQVEYAPNTSWTGFWGTHVNRGLALDADNVYIGSNCRLLAVGRKTHQLVWSAQSCDPTKLQAITGAPRIGAGKVFIGNASGDFGGDRGFMDAFDAKTGRHMWRFFTMPGDPSKPFESELYAQAAKTWGTDYWKYTQGGVSPWDAITYDEKSDTLYFGTDGPAPWMATQRAPDAGDELFTDSIIAVDATTGQYKWHFQTVQHDSWNLAATMHIMLADLSGRTGTRRALMFAPKNGFFYVLDAHTGKFISGKNYIPVNWTTGLDPETGRAIPASGGNYWEHPNEDIIALPGDVGGHNWEAMAFNPGIGLAYIPATIVPVRMTVDKEVFGGVNPDYYYGLRPDAKIKMHGELIAWDPLTQTARWHAERSLPVNGGILATAGNLVFQGTGDGKFEAFDAGTGNKMWSFDVGGSILAAPTTVIVQGVQYILVSSGNGGASGMRGIPRLMNGLRSQGPARLLAFRIGGKTPLPIDPPAPFPKPALPKPSMASALEGKHTFAKYVCNGCHGVDAIGSTPGLPDLRRMSPETAAIMRKIVIEGLLRPAGMPPVPTMTDHELATIRAFVMRQAWTEYERDQRVRSKH